MDKSEFTAPDIIAQLGDSSGHITAPNIVAQLGDSPGHISGISDQGGQSSLTEDLIMQSAAAKRTIALGEGALYAIPGFGNAFVHDCTHLDQLAEKAGMAATIGIAMRVLLPKTGAGKAVVGAIMGYYMARDAIQPLIHGWEESASAKNMDQLDRSARNIGNGLGAFAWDAFLGSKVGLRAEKYAGAALDARLGPAGFAAFEKAKVDLDSTFVTKPLQTILSPIGRFTNWASEKMVTREAEPKIEFEQVKHQFAEVEAQNASRMDMDDSHRLGARGSDGGRLGYSETIDLIQMGLSPDKVASTDVHKIVDPEGLKYRINRMAAGDNHSAEAQAAGEQTSDKPYVNRAEQEVNAGNYGKLAVMNKAYMSAWTDKRVLIEDAKERFAGPVHAAVSPEYKKMDPGYIKVRNQMMQIAAQVKDEEDLRYVLPLFSRFSMAATQHISDGLSQSAALKYQLDLMALEAHSELVRNMKAAGINADVVLRSKNPAIFSISHDGGKGPHTMRQIDGSWNLDHVLYARNMIDTRSITASGIYQHELGHDQYGGILKFDEGIREQVIANAIAKGLGARAGDKIWMPGTGNITKQQLFEAIFKAQADENTADIWGAAWAGHNTGGAMGILLQSLRSHGKLEVRSVFGIEHKAPENPFGFEEHAFDALRPKIVAATMRARANGDPRVLDYASALERYANEASDPGDYVMASQDATNPGQLTIPRKELEGVIPFLIDAQLNTRLSALQGHTFADILPDLPANLAKMDALADLMVDAIKTNKKPGEIPFDVSRYKIIQVFGAGLPAVSRLVAAGMDATEANTAVNTMSDHLRGLYHGNDPHVDPLKPSVLQTIRLTSPKSLAAGTARATREFVSSSGQVIGNTSQLGDWLAGRSTPYAIRAGVVGIDKNFRDDFTARSLTQIGQNLTALDRTRKEVLNNPEKP